MLLLPFSEEIILCAVSLVLPFSDAIQLTSVGNPSAVLAGLSVSVANPALVKALWNLLNLGDHGPTGAVFHPWDVPGQVPGQTLVETTQSIVAEREREANCDCDS